MQFFLSCIPPKTSHHAKRIVRRGRFTSLADKPELVAAKEDLLTMLRSQAPASLMVGPLRLSLLYVWPYNSGDPKKARAAGTLIPHCTKPDCDNLAKTFIDCMVRAAYFAQDSRIVQLSVSKYRGDTPGILVSLMEWQKEND